MNCVAFLSAAFSDSCRALFLVSVSETSPPHLLSIPLQKISERNGTWCTGNRANSEMSGQCTQKKKRHTKNLVEKNLPLGYLSFCLPVHVLLELCVCDGEVAMPPARLALSISRRDCLLGVFFVFPFFLSSFIVVVVDTKERKGKTQCVCLPPLDGVDGTALYKEGMVTMYFLSCFLFFFISFFLFACFSCSYRFLLQLGLITNNNNNRYNKQELLCLLLTLKNRLTRKLKPLTRMSVSKPNMPLLLLRSQLPKLKRKPSQLLLLLKRRPLK